MQRRSTQGEKGCWSWGKCGKSVSCVTNGLSIKSWPANSFSLTKAALQITSQEWNGSNYSCLVKNLIKLNFASYLWTPIHLRSYYLIIYLTFSHLQVENKLLFHALTHTHSHSTPAPLTVYVKWGCRYFRVSVASLLRRESPLYFPPWPRSLSPHANTADKSLFSFCCSKSLWWPTEFLVRWRTESLEARMLP